MRIIFHDNSLCLYGTSVALYDYAYFCKHLFGFDCSILYHQNHFANSDLVIEKFKKEFSVYSYTDHINMQSIIDKINPDAFFMIKSGNWDNVISKTCKNWILAVGPYNKETYGDKFFVASKWLSRVSGGIEYVPHMVNLPDVEGDMRKELDIPKDSIVFGRNGGYDSFDISFAKKAVVDSLEKRDDIYFLFQGTERFVNHPRVIHIPASTDLIEKVKFINTSDALLHARTLGESFGLTCAEFSSKNKPVITWYGSNERNHIEILGEKGLYYNNYDELLDILVNFQPNPDLDWNCYREYLPNPVMKKFYSKYIL